MDSFGKHFFTGTAFSTQKDSSVTLGHCLGGIDQADHWRTLVYDVVESDGLAFFCFRNKLLNLAKVGNGYD